MMINISSNAIQRHLKAKREIVQIVPQSKIGCWKLYLESESVSYHWLKIKAAVCSS